MSKNAIELINVSKTFIMPKEKIFSLKETFISIVRGRWGHNKVNSLRNINLSIRKGETLGVIGRNGSGKSTLLKIIAGVYCPDFGSVKVNGKLSPFLELGLGFHWDLSAVDNVRLYCAILGMTSGEIDSKIDSIFRFAELEEFRSTPIKAFSSGMQVRLAFSTAIHLDAPIMLIDEVLAVGDFEFQKKCLDVFQRFRREGRTIVFVSHNMEAVREFCSRVICLEEGRIIKQGNPHETINFYMKTLKEHC